MANTDTDRIRYQQITKPPDPAETDLVINDLYSLFQKFVPAASAYKKKERKKRFILTAKAVCIHS